MVGMSSLKVIADALDAIAAIATRRIMFLICCLFSGFQFYYSSLQIFPFIAKVKLCLLKKDCTYFIIHTDMNLILQ